MTEKLLCEIIGAGMSSQEDYRNVMRTFAEYVSVNNTISRKLALILKVKFPFWSWLTFKDSLRADYEKKKDAADLLKLEKCEREMVYIHHITGQYTPLMICGNREVKDEDIGAGYYPPVASDSTELLGIWFLNHACNHDWHGGRGFHYIKANEWNYLKRN